MRTVNEAAPLLVFEYNIMTQNKIAFLVDFLLIISFLPCKGQLQFYSFLPGEAINVSASSTYSPGCAPENLINSSGLDGILHDNSMNAFTMWHSHANPEASSAFPGTATGTVWISFEFDAVYELRELWLWNHNQPGYTSRGLKDVVIEYSVDGENWKKHGPHNADHWIIPEASGLSGQEPGLIIDCNNIQAKFFVITTTGEEGNYGDDYYGMSEVRFVLNEPLLKQTELSVKGTNKVIRHPVPAREYLLYVPDGIAYGEDQIIIQHEEFRDTVHVSATEKAFHDKKIVIHYKQDNGDISDIMLTSINDSHTKRIPVEPPKQWTVYLFPQSHVDIGYTHRQEKAAKIQNKNIDYAIELARKTQDYPEGSQFKWNVEVLWVLDNYLKDRSPQEIEKLKDAIQKGWINLDASYASINTSISNGEQLLRLFGFGNHLKEKFDIPLLSAQQVDVPGMSWGTVTAMEQNDLKYMLNMPNMMEDLSLENYPFYWKDPSGENSILHFQTYYYNLGYELRGRYIPNYLTGHNDPYYTDNPDQYFLHSFIFSFLDKAYNNGYTYDLMPLAWIMTDNAPPDPDLPGVVKEWNKKYKNPTIKISSVLDFFADFEDRYAGNIPVLQGDYNEWWTDGVASGARETAINRENTEKILQLETLFAMLQPENYEQDRFDDIWKNILLFTEHTWGSYKSISDPDHPDVKTQWEVKKGFAVDAASDLELMLQTFQRANDGNTSNKGSTITIYNTNSWRRSDVCIIPADLSSTGDLVLTEHGDTVLTQRLSSGELAIYVDSINAFGSRTYSVHHGNSSIDEGIDDHYIANEYYSVHFDKNSGLVNITSEKTGVVFDNIFSDDQYFFRYVRSESRDTLLAQLDAVRVKESGPLVNSLLLEFIAPGCDSYKLEIRLIKDKDHIELHNYINKYAERNKEKLSFVFPFSLENAEVNYQIPWGVVSPDRDLLPGSNKRFYTVQHFVDVSANNEGYTLVSLDAPIIQIQRDTEPGVVAIESVVIDNNWHVNFRASQEGNMVFRYNLRAHNGFSLQEASRFGLESMHPFIILDNNELDASAFPLNGWTNEGIIATSCKPLKNGKGIALRLFNVSEAPATTVIDAHDDYTVWESNFLEIKKNRIPRELFMKPFEVKTIILTSN